VPGLPPSLGGSAAQYVHVGRMPLYDRAGEIVGYELLFRATGDAARAARNDTEASRQVIVNAFAEFGLQQLVGHRLGFVNLTRDFLVGDLAVPFEPRQAVLEVLETVRVDEAVVAGVAALAEQGYRIALDDFVWGSGHEQLLRLASHVKLEVAGVDTDRLTGTVRACREYPGVQLVAERLETDDDLRLARGLGFDVFQGYLLGRPQVVSAAAMSPSQTRRMELLAQLSRPDAALGSITSIVALDPALSYRMLRLASSAALGARRRVSSVHEAMVLIGTRRLFQWLSLMAISDILNLGEAHQVSTLARARLCQLLAERLRISGASAFTVGVLSGVSELLGVPLADLTTQLPLTDDVTAALVGGNGGLGTVLALAQDCAAGRVPDTGGLPISAVDLSEDHVAALTWAMHTYQQVLC
jgi:c-di-GMP-related signal transduction protein